MEDNSAKRSKNFSKQELEVLVEGVVSRRKILMGKLDNVVTADNKKRAWAKVAQSVSAVGETEHDAIAIKKNGQTENQSIIYYYIIVFPPHSEPLGLAGNTSEGLCPNQVQVYYSHFNSI